MPSCIAILPGSAGLGPQGSQVVLPAAAFPAWRPLARRAGALAVALAAAAGLFIGAARAATPREGQTPRLVAPSDMKSGALLLKTGEEGRYVEAPRLGTDYDITVSGPTIRGRVSQIFHNPTEGWVEAVYVYPLSEGAAVDSLKMVIGSRIVVADIKERAEARRTFEAAKAAGQKAALMEQERPNLFTNSVANIGPGETVVIALEYQEPVRQSGETFSLRLPLVVGPRYNPPPLVQVVDYAPGGEGWGRMIADPVPDRNRIAPPVLDPGTHAPVNPVTIGVRLAAGFPLADMKSHHHAVTVTESDDGARILKLADGAAVPADRDFELTWTPRAGSVPSVGVFRERVGDSDYVIGFVTPPLASAEQVRRPREVILVIDNSGSMGGTSIREAKASLEYALGRLAPEDRFNVIRFDNTFDMLHPDAVPATPASLAEARRWVGRLEANGGTEMVPAMRAALADRRAAEDSATLRQVVFLTDGAIGNESELFDTIAGMRGRSRVFMVGIGSAPNTYLMTRAAETGRGTFTHIGAPEQVETRMRALFEKLENPAVTALSARLSVSAADVTPDTLPDLYRGEPLVIAARLPGTSALEGAELHVEGMIGDQPWTATVPLGRAQEGRGLSKLWARRKIADAEVQRTLRQVTPDEADRRILALALEHHLVTRLTSLVAVDKMPSRPDGAKLTRADIPLNLPAGWDFERVFGNRRPAAMPRAPGFDAPGFDVPQDHRPAQRAEGVAPIRTTKVAAANYQAVASASQPRPIGPAAQQVPLPRTATDAGMRMLLGVACLFAAMLLLGLRMRRTGHAAPAVSLPGRPARSQ